MHILCDIILNGVFLGALLGNEERRDAFVTIRGGELWLHRRGDGRRSRQLSQNHAQTWNTGELVLFILPLISLVNRMNGREKGAYQNCEMPVLLAIIANSDLRHGPEFDCNQLASPVRGARALIDFYSSCL